MRDGRTSLRARRARSPSRSGLLRFFQVHAPAVFGIAARASSRGIGAARSLGAAGLRGAGRRSFSHLGTGRCRFASIHRRTLLVLRGRVRRSFGPL